MRQTGTLKNGQKYEYNSLDSINTRMNVYFCRTCALKMYEPNKGFDYRCADCHEKAKGWC